jgi:hypothetical protein
VMYMPTIHATNTVVFPNLNPVSTDQQIALTVSTRIVTLLQQGTILAQHRLSKKQFRLLTLLLKLPGGALHAELLAILHCSDTMIADVLAAADELAVSLIIQREVAHWKAHLQEVAHMGPRDKRRELAILRRSLTGKRGLNTILKEFGIVALPVYKQGYVLCSLQQKNRVN